MKVTSFKKITSFMFRIALLALGLCFSTAYAAPLISLSAVGEQTSSVAGVTTVDFNGGNCAGYASCSGDYALVSGNASGLYAAPAGDSTMYLSVPNPSSSTHSANFQLGTQANYFGLLWGSIDSYNAISFFLDNALVASFSGADIVGSSANGDQISYASNRYINFDFGQGSYDTVQLTSSGFAFESDNHAFRKSVSEPMNLALFGLGLIGLLITRRLNRSRV